MQNYEKKLRQLIREAVNSLFNEGTDNFTIKDERFFFKDDEAIPFLYFNDVLYLGDFRGSHWDIVYNKLEKDISLYKMMNLMNVRPEYKDEVAELNAQDKAENQIKALTEYNGRLWTKRKVVAFWQYPTKEKLNSIINDLNQKFHKLKIDDSWRILVTVNSEEELIPISEYTGSGKLSPEDREKYKQHMMSPLEKEKQGLTVTPKGWGSTHKDYAGHREIDRVLGRAEE